MIIKCGYKQENYCKCYEETIEEVEKERKEKCCDTCHQAVEVYTDKDKVRMFYEAFEGANKEKSAYEVAYMRGICGHSSSLKDDFDDLYYMGYTVWLVVHKKYKHINRKDILKAFDCMRLMGMKIPKRIRREIRRIKGKREGY